MNCANHQNNHNQEPALNSGSAMRGIEAMISADKLHTARMDKLRLNLGRAYQA